MRAIHLDGGDGVGHWGHKGEIKKKKGGPDTWVERFGVINRSLSPKLTKCYPVEVAVGLI